MSLTWTDTRDIAIELAEKYPDLEPTQVRFTDLHRYVTDLDDFADDPLRSNEKILEAIMLCWVEERD